MPNQIPESRQDRIVKEAMQFRVPLTAYAWSQLRDHGAAEDVVQDAMLVVMQKYDEFEDGTSMLAWCRSIVRLKILKWRERQQREQSLIARLLDDAMDAAFEASQSKASVEHNDEMRKRFAHCLERVSQRSRRLLDGRYAEGLSYEAIGQRCGMQLEAVRKSLFRVKRRLRLCVEKVVIRE